eukprot:gnl/TRDRNA2_/TRDRNA2_165445_c1_seq1.p2 gnl/TRDRNA2_/TRDRNA2_165445_c1~~gnl/TRDRNA2_/TRDRNA2_165445_c1_seq1.p2  ORF type:complete len:105 (-),score=16.12 gnl/TRDRNA2_/TRDRNA2_165445_c1_seq1:194-508(-)
MDMELKGSISAPLAVPNYCSQRGEAAENGLKAQPVASLQTVEGELEFFESGGSSARNAQQFKLVSFCDMDSADGCAANLHATWREPREGGVPVPDTRAPFAFQE